MTVDLHCSVEWFDMGMKVASLLELKGVVYGIEKYEAVPGGTRVWLLPR